MFIEITQNHVKNIKECINAKLLLNFKNQKKNQKTSITVNYRKIMHSTINIVRKEFYVNEKIHIKRHTLINSHLKILNV